MTAINKWNDKVYTVFSMLGTDNGINKGLNILKAEVIKQGFKLDNEEAQNAK